MGRARVSAVPEMEALRVDVAEGVELAAWRWRGDGTPFLLVHGLASNAHLWDGVAAELAGAGHDVVAVDLRGHGRSSKPAGPYDLATVARDVAVVVETLALDRPVAVGQSYGGNVALTLGVDRPDLVRGISGIDGGFLDVRARFPNWADAARALAPPNLAGTPLEEMESFLHTRHPDWPASSIKGAMACFDVRDDGTIAPWLTLDHHLQVLEGLWRSDPPSLWRRLDLCMLLIAADSPRGDSEWAAEKRASVEIAEQVLRCSRVVWMSGDHDLHAQHPAEVASLLRSCLTDGFWPPT